MSTECPRCWWERKHKLIGIVAALLFLRLIIIIPIPIIGIITCYMITCMAVGLKPHERRASARRSCEKDGQNERRRVKATDDGPPMRRRGGMRPETLGMSPRDDHLVILATQGRNGAAGFGDQSTLGLYRPPAPRLGAGATTILARFFAPSDACMHGFTRYCGAPMRRYRYMYVCSTTSVSYTHLTLPTSDLV